VVLSCYQAEYHLHQIFAAARGGTYFDDRTVRDYLNIECKAASHYTLAGWRSVITEATEFRLAQYQSRDVYLCIAVGRFFMIFAWCPNDPLQNPLWMQGQSWRQNFDPRLVPIRRPYVTPQTGDQLSPCDVDHDKVIDSLCIMSR